MLDSDNNVIGVNQGIRLGIHRCWTVKY
jgi:hypothetical protein